MIEELLKNVITREDYNLNIKESRYTFNNYTVPRTTEIISKMISEEYLMGWSNHLGFKRQSYKKVLQEASDIGTAGHNAIEDYLTNGNVIENFPLKSFMSWWDSISKNNKVFIVGIEKKLSCQWFGGTYDMIVNINGKNYLVDFKTSNHVSYKYFLQMASYIYMIDIKIDGCIILQVDKHEIAYEEYLLSFDIPEHAAFIAQCQQTFLSLVFSYYNIYKTSDMYDAIFKH